MQFSPDLRDQVADGAITVSYRLWSRPRVKVGGTYRTASVWIEIDEIDLVPFSSITPEDVALTGESDLEALRRRAAHAGDIHDNTVVYRVEFHVVTRPDEAHRWLTETHDRIPRGDAQGNPIRDDHRPC